MKDEYIIAMHEHVDMSRNHAIQLISSFNDKRDVEVAAIVCAWLSNGHPTETQAMRNVLYGKMKGKPYEYVFNVDNEIEHECNHIICGMLTSSHFNRLVTKIRKCYESMDSVKSALIEKMSESNAYGIKYGHEALAMLFGGGTMLPTVSSVETFYRYNLMAYWLNYIYHIWDFPTWKHFLLPCNDMTFKMAHKTGIVSHRMKTSLANTISLTKKAKKVFGEKEYYKMYELLNWSAV